MSTVKNMSETRIKRTKIRRDNLFSGFDIS